MIPAMLGSLASGSPAIVYSLPDGALQVPSTTHVAVSAPVSNLDAVGTATISGGINPQVSADGSTWGSSASIAIGGTIYARTDTSASYNVITTATVTISSSDQSAVSDSFAVTTCNQPTYTFPDLTHQAPGSTFTTASVNSGCNLGGAVTFTGSSGGVGASVVGGNTITANANFQITGSAPSNYGSTYTVQVRLAGYSDSFNVTTKSAPTGSFQNANITGAAPNTDAYGNIFTFHSNDTATSGTITLVKSGFSGGAVKFGPSGISTTKHVTDANDKDQYQVLVVTGSGTGHTWTVTVQYQDDGGGPTLTLDTWSVST